MEIGLSQGFYFPVYFDPDFAEILALTESFDTLRIGIHKENNQEHLVVASGHGNTHSTLSRCLGELNPRQKLSWRDGLKYGGLNGGCLILYEENRRLWFNPDSFCDLDSEKVPINDVLKLMKEPAKTILKEICKQAILQQNLLE